MKSQSKRFAATYTGGDDAPLAPRVCHRRCAQRLDADHLDFGRQGLHHMTHTGCQRPAAESNQDGVERRHGVHQFQADGRRALAGLDVQAVFDQPDAVVPRDSRRSLPGTDTTTCTGGDQPQRCV